MVEKKISRTGISMAGYFVMCSNFRRLKVRLGYCSEAEEVEALLIIRRNG